ncbi:hypothetical protein HBI37_024630 [Parastagonospora nodorum]|nr:hypothetical protein HBI79_046990 [Parastagonospora nodorum]KAH5060606.1 hypothetical protein HBH96_079330 [Parastagonospora nodorum]KAH5696292.1 hypothetical protein HBI44_115070 [Parastagonospora nodorum]KAH6354615.1 hypothetical protein HBI37_024630 [Parastagonospora nodorum]KAH6365848.1 hypothetical protein HBI36_041170 [Parastagonospora nodorum]
MGYPNQFTVPSTFARVASRTLPQPNHHIDLHNLSGYTNWSSASWDTPDPPPIPISELSAYPALYFFHSALAAPLVLQNLLSSPFPLKLCKARLYGYIDGTNSTVILSCENFGEWAPEPKVTGVVFEVTCEREENVLRDYAGPDVEVEDTRFESRKGSVFFGVKKLVHRNAFVRKDVGQAFGIEKKEQHVSDSVPDLEGDDECDIFEALRTEYPSPATPKEHPANAEQNYFITPVNAPLGTSRQKWKNKATLSQQWDSGQPLTRTRTGSKPAVFIIGDDSEEGSSGVNTGTHTSAYTASIKVETEHAPYFPFMSTAPFASSHDYTQRHPSTLSFITSHPSVDDAAQINSNTWQTPLVRPHSSNNLAPDPDLDAASRPKSLTSLLKAS